MRILKFYNESIQFKLNPESEIQTIFKHLAVLQLELKIASLQVIEESEDYFLGKLVGVKPFIKQP